MSCHSLCSVHCGAGLGNTELPSETLYPELLSSITVPSDVQISTIQDVIRAVEEIGSKYHELTRLKAAITNLQGTTNLNRRCAELREFANIHRGMISGMRRFSSELLTEIFLRYVLMETRFHGPWIIATVCSRWRAVALSSPSLWCHFLGTQPRTPAALLSAQLERSRNSPIYLDFLSYSFQTDADSLNALDLFLAASTRWREVTLQLSSEDMSHLGAFAGTFPLLQTLAIRNRQLGASLAAPFAVLPSLTDLELHCRDIPRSPSPRSADASFMILAPSAAFYVCRYRAPTDPDAVLPPTTSHIHSLHFSGCNVLFVRNVLRALVAPALTDLTVVENYRTPIVPCIIQVLSNARCLLTRLCLLRTEISANGLRRVLELAPGLAELEIDIRPAYEAEGVLEVLATSGLAPLLRRLVLLNSKVLCLAKIMDMLHSRVDILESVDLAFLLPGEDVEELYVHGMQVSCRGHVQEVRTKETKGIALSSVT
ncbi:hypothetical protein C8J57DRAFT_1562269 [Mycena rebaudengoi]|nr:hypothetical protein C8J57DRAFT_1562269 [Mycena rebaudengoi]